MSERGREQSESGKAIYRAIDKGGHKKIVSDASFLIWQIKLYKAERRQDWVFFTVFIFVLLDFVLFAILRNYLPLMFVVMQGASLALLVWKNGVLKTWQTAAAILSRLTENRGEKFKQAKTQNSGASDDVSPERLDELAEEAGAVKLARSQDWFVFITLALIFLDVVFFSALNNWAGPASLLVLEAFILFVFGEKMGMKSICELISKLLGIAAKKMGDKG